MNYFKYFENFINVMMHRMDPETDHTRSGPVLGDLKTARASQHMQSVQKKMICHPKRRASSLEITLHKVSECAIFPTAQGQKAQQIATNGAKVMTSRRYL